MRFQGKVTQWDDAKGFGFIAVEGGDQRLFFHHSALARGSPRPALGMGMSFEVENGPKGKRALRVTPDARSVGAAQPRPVRSQHDPTAQRAQAHRSRTATTRPASLAPLLLLLGFALFWLALATLAHPPRWAVPAYLVLSTVTFIAYALDKTAAKRGAWRTNESTLHLIALLGGWPGAFLAQHRLRHKSQKPSFQAMFWLTVALNILALIALSTAWGQALLKDF